MLAVSRNKKIFTLVHPWPYAGAWAAADNHAWSSHMQMCTGDDSCSSVTFFDKMCADMQMLFVADGCLFGVCCCGG